jgi:hypothetical protein
MYGDSRQFMSGHARGMVLEHTYVGFDPNTIMHTNSTPLVKSIAKNEHHTLEAVGGAEEEVGWEEGGG